MRALHCAVGLDILKFKQISLFCSVSYFSLVGAWSFVSEGLSLPKPPPPVEMGLCGKTSACFLCNWLGNVLRSRDMPTLQDMSKLLFISNKHNRAQSGTTHAGSVYSASWGKTCAGTILPSFEHHWLRSWCGTISRDNWLGFKSLRLGFGIRPYGQGLGSSFRSSGSVSIVRI